MARRYPRWLLAVVLGWGLLGWVASADAFIDQLIQFVQSRFQTSRSYAVVIGIDAYQHVPDLRYAVNDAKSVATLLRHLGYDLPDSAVLTRAAHDPQRHLTKARILATIQDVLRRTRSHDRVVIFYAGHGREMTYRTGQTEAFLLPSDYEPRDIFGTGLSFRDLVRRATARDVKARHVLFLLDACYAGDALELGGLRDPVGPADQRFFQHLLENPAVAVITAGGRGQQVREINRHGVFTNLLVRGLAGAADTDVNGLVHFSELVAWLEPEVYTASGPYQQDVQAGRVLGGRGQPVFVVPDDGVRQALLGDWRAQEVRADLRERCLRQGKACPYIERGARSEVPEVPPVAERPVLQRAQIRQVQTRLKAAGFDPGPIDGVLGERTRAALRQYQAQERLPVTGQIDQLTWATLMEQDMAPPVGPRVAVGVYPQPPSEKTLTNGIGMEFVRIPAGEFLMGSQDRAAYENEQPVHLVRISRPFYLGTYEVTQQQWQTVMGNNPSRFKGDPNLPVKRVSWEDAQEFIRKLNAQEGHTKYRLPTEAEWEYAARATSTTAYSFGDDPQRLSTYAWYRDNSGGKTHPVGQKQPNDWGLYDMHGNVWEWVQDWYGDYSAKPQRDPSGPETGSDRVIRGGSWGGDAAYCRSAFRSIWHPAGRRDDLGFRLAREVS